MKTKGFLVLCLLVIALAGNAGASSVSCDAWAGSNLYVTDYYDPSQGGWVSPLFQQDYKTNTVSSSSFASQTLDTKAFFVVTETRETKAGSQDFLFSVGATSHISQRAGFGNLGMAVYGGASNAPMSYYYEDQNGDYQAAETTAAAEGDASGSVEWHDTLTVLSDTLPLGSEVKLRATGTVTGSSSASPIDFFGTAAGFGATFSAPWAMNVFSTDPVPTQTIEETLLVGNTYPIGGILGAHAYTFAGWNPMRLSDHVVWHVQDASAAADVWNTASFYLDVVTPGVYYTTASGTNYSTPVPAPSTLLLLISGLPGLAMVRRFRKQLLPFLHNLNAHSMR